MDERIADELRALGHDVEGGILRFHFPDMISAMIRKNGRRYAKRVPEENCVEALDSFFRSVGNG